MYLSETRNCLIFNAYSYIFTDIACLSNPCSNGATCLPDDTTDDGDDYTCTCDAGTTGTHCENCELTRDLYDLFLYQVRFR